MSGCVTEGILERIVARRRPHRSGLARHAHRRHAIGRVARASQPYIQQIFVGRDSGHDAGPFERKLYVMRKRAETAVAAETRTPEPRRLLRPVAFLAHHRL